MKPPIPIHRGHVPFVRLLLALSLGIVAGQLLMPEPSFYQAAWVLLAAVSASFVATVCVTRLRQRRYYGLLGGLILSALFIVGCLSVWRTDPKIDRHHFSHFGQGVLIGYVAAEPVVRPDRVRFPFKVTHVYRGDSLLEVRGKLMLTVSTREATVPPAFHYGVELLIPGVYQRVPPPYNPGEMNYRRYLENKHIWHQSYVLFADVEPIGAAQGNALVARARSLQRWLVAKFKRYITDRDALSVASTLILGDRADLSDELLQAFSNTGTIHVLSVSGMHVVIVFWLLAYLLKWLDRHRNMRIVKFAVMLVSVWCYAALTGFSPSVLRAAAMISFVIAASTFGQQNRIYNSIAASAFFLLLYDPKFIADIGFQLSYLAVLGIVCWVPLWKAIFPGGHRLVRPIGDYIGMSMAAQAGAGPMAVYYFHQFPVYFLVANLLIVLPASGIMYLGFLLLVLPSGTLAAFTGAMLEQLILAVNAGLQYIERLPFATIQGIGMTAWECARIYFLMLAFSLAFINRSKYWMYAGLSILFLGISAAFIAGFQEGKHRELILFNVRNNLAIGLIDGGEAWVYTDLGTMDTPTFRYAVRPGLEAHVPASRIHLLPRDSGYASEQVYANGPILQFGAVRLMIYNGVKTYRGHLEVDVLLIRENPTGPLTELVESIACQQLVVDGSNDLTTIHRLTVEAEAMGIPLYVLKDNLAYRHLITD